jgi:acyl-CoA thioesterase-1
MYMHRYAVIAYGNWYYMVMHFILAHKWLTGTGIVLLCILLLLAWQVLYITQHYTASVPTPTIPRTTEQFGSGMPLRFVVLGDSTSIGQGAEYDKGIARMSARFLARSHMVALTNYGISGARVADVRQQELAKATAMKPDLVLIAIGANDVTHLTALSSVRTDMQFIITQLQRANPTVKIILTGSPAMGSVARFAPPTQWIAGRRVRQINAVFSAVTTQTHTILLPLAQKTGYAFKHDPSLFAADNFHPNARGYAVWQPVIEAGLAQATLAQ